MVILENISFCSALKSSYGLFQVLPSNQSLLIESGQHGFAKMALISFFRKLRIMWIVKL